MGVYCSLRENELEKHRKPAHNWRFGASGGVTPRKVKWEYEHLCTVWIVSYPPTAPSRWDVKPNDMLSVFIT